MKGKKRPLSDRPTISPPGARFAADDAVDVCCPCGKSYHVRRSLIGQSARCFACGTLLLIGGSPTAACESRAG